ncbi:MAG: hypothetical protein ABDH19_02130 [Thermodesulfovibrio sp.]
MSRKIKFQCVMSCSYVCCGGATIVTLKEIGKLYRFFPITIGFRKIYPFDFYHKKYLEDFVIKYKGFYIIGDFIAGNRLKKRCRLIKDSLCSIHENFKPLQCSVIPFSVTFPESLQNLVIAEKRKGVFKNCKGFHDDAPVVWDGEFTDQKLKESFYALRENFIQQKDIMERIFLRFETNVFFERFIRAENGFFEVPIVGDFIDELCSVASIKEKKDFLKIQKTLFINELTVGGIKNSLFIEALNSIDFVKI